jgi:hypothetical protein
MRPARNGRGKRLERLGVAAAIVLLPIAPLLYVGCTDGATPNCADPAIQCGPDVEATGDQQLEAALFPEAMTRDSASDTALEAAADGPLDALDAGDEG